MAWIIDRDHLAEQEPEERRARPGTNDNAVGVIGPRSYQGNGHELRNVFRMLDSDGVVYYTGRCDTDDDENALGPLDDFGAPNAGATTIQYWTPGVCGGWKNLN
jgi:hypothetical protein